MIGPWAVLGLLIAGAVIALVLVAVGVVVAGHFSDVAYKRYQQGLNDGWKAHEVRRGIARGAHAGKAERKA